MALGRGILWCNLGRTVRLGPLDGRATIFILLAVYNWAIWTLVLAVVMTIVLFLVERQGYTIPNLVRRMSVMIMGRHRPASSYRSIRSDR